VTEKMALTNFTPLKITMVIEDLLLYTTLYSTNLRLNNYTLYPNKTLEGLSSNKIFIGIG
jgi:hypothetical protein